MNLIGLGPRLTSSLADEVLKMFSFWKKRRVAEQNRRIETLLEAQKSFQEQLYSQDSPRTLQDELAAVKATLERSEG